MIKSLLKNSLIALTFSSVTLFADTTEVVWDAAAQPGQLEAAITAGGAGVYRLSLPSVAGGKWLTSEHIPVDAGQAIHIIGEVPASADVKPVTIQPLANAEGALGHQNGLFFTLVGAGAELKLENLILNAYASGEEGSLQIAGATSTDNKIIVNNCIVSHVNFLAFFTLGKNTDFHITNSVFKAFTNGPGGMFYGGVVWGAGSWLGTIDTLEFRQNTVDGVIGEALVIYEHVDHGIIDHNTFTNVVMDMIWYRGQNNLQVTNNLLYNTKSYGQSTYDVSGWGVWWEGGVGQMALRKAGLVNPDGFEDITPAVVQIDTSDQCVITTTITTPADTQQVTAGTYIMSDGQVVNMNDRNINWSNNAAVWSPALTGFMNNMANNPWSWTVTTVTPDSMTITPAVFDTITSAYAADGSGCVDSIFVTTAADTVVHVGSGGTTTVTVHDTMLTAAQQMVWADDSTLATIAAGIGVTSTNNAVLNWSDLQMQLDEMYITKQLARTLDFRDDQTTQGVGANNNWSYEHDGNMNTIEWPMHYNASYSSVSTAATHSTTGGPIGDPRWSLVTLGTDNSTALPKEFALKQNYPNPFNPTTEIEFSIAQASTVNLTIFNVLGQKVKVLANGVKLAGTHKLRWNGTDEMGQSASTGIYFYTLTDGSSTVTKKMAFMK